jgi:5-methyltetrahydrofolate--homocysteine methyltransferase
MDRQAFHRRLEDEVLILDGAMGSLLQEWGLPSGMAPEEWNLTNPEALEDIHRLYVASGADIILTNTFGGSRTKLEHFGLGGKVGAVNRSAVEVARKAARGTAWVAATIGPLGENLHPLGTLSFGEALGIFREQAEVMSLAGVDLIILETMDDLPMVKAAALAAREVFDGPILALLTFSDGGVTVTGVGPEAAAVAIGDLDIDGIGANCSAGPEELLPVLAKMAAWTDLPLVVEPNAGLPILRSGKTVFPGSPSLMARYAKKFVDAGVNIIGGCCGTTPKHINAIRKVAKAMLPAKRTRPPGTLLAGRRRVVVVGGGGPGGFIGERINPSGRKDLRLAALQKRWSAFASEARRQVEEGTPVVDVNVGVAGLDEPTAMVEALRAIQGRVDVPLCIDTSDPATMEAALAEVQGKALLNSVTAEEARLDAVLPMVRRFGAAVVGLALDEDGIPETAEGRLEAARKIVYHALSLGIRRENVLIDPLVMAVSAGGQSANVSLRALTLIREELRVQTVMGVSNVSHGLPMRSRVNAHFLLMALSRGLDLPILDPFARESRQALYTADLLLDRDPHARRFIAHCTSDVPKKGRKGSGRSRAPTPRGKLRDAVIEGAADEIVNRVEAVLETGIDPVDVTKKILVPALEEVGLRFNRQQLFLPQMVLSAEAVQAAFGFLKSRFPKDVFRSSGKILIATVRGDIHEIGKNIVLAILENHGFEVKDLGRDVSTERIIKAQYEEKPDIVCLSALMTTTMMEMEKTVLLLGKEGITPRILVGGAVVTRSFAKDIGADGYGADAMEAVKLGLREP